MVARPIVVEKVFHGLRRSPDTAIIGPRQCGKTTIARQIANERVSHCFDLEDPEDDLRLREPKLNLSSLVDLIILDEIQRRPALLLFQRVLADLALKRACIVYPGTQRYAVHDRVECVGLSLFREWADGAGILNPSAPN